MNDESAVLIQNFQKICLMQRDKLKILKKYAYALKQGANCRSEVFEYLKLDLFKGYKSLKEARANKSSNMQITILSFNMHYYKPF